MITYLKIRNYKSKHGREFVKSRDDLKIAHHASPEEIAKQCASFAKFQKILLSR